MPIYPPVQSQCVRCAIYTRKSVEKALDAPTSSLVTQREVCQAYIKCQSHRHWVEVPHQYDDGGYSGGNLQRPALQRMIADIKAGRIDVVVIYKIDRLSRSLTDFVRLMDVLNKYGASFVSVTQTFDTSDSMGRLVLNILLTFAQFEREIIGDRIRDKKAQMKAKGLFTGGTPPAGYRRSPSGKLLVDPQWAPIVQEIFRRFPETSLNRLAHDLNERGILSRRYKTKDGNVRGGKKLWEGMLLKIIKNPIYAGHFLHHGELLEAQVEPLVTKEAWEKAQHILATRFPVVRDPIRNFLIGILHDELGFRMHVFSGRSRQPANYRYYQSKHASWVGETGRRKVMVEADRVEQLAVSAMQAFLIDRIKVKQAILALGLYSDHVARILKRGQLSARRLALMDNAQLREFFVAVVPRAEVTRNELRLLVSCYELSRYLAWDGQGLFRKSEVRPVHGVDRFRLVYAPASLICGRPCFILPVRPRPPGAGVPDPGLVDLLEQAADVRHLMLSHRDKDIAQLARERKMGATFFSRLVRLNYLAPDIQAAIYDGTQPATLTRHHILFGSMPLDWEQQRQLMGFN